MPKYKGFNEYKIIGEIVEIYSCHKGNKFISIMDRDDLKTLIDYDVCWHPFYSKTSKRYYMNCTWWGENNKKTTIYLHRFILNAPSGFYVDHINHDGLDNRRENLKITNMSENTKNRRGINCNNKSGYRNVCLYDNKWIVQLQIDGKNKVFGKFDDLDKAGSYAENLRKKYY